MNNDEDSAVERAVAAILHDTDIGYRLREINKAVHDAQRDGRRSEPGALRKEIADLYEAFQDRKLSTPFEYCECCITASMASHWQTSEIRHLDAGDLWKIMSNVPHTAGTAEDLLYFTPRILEHAFTEDSILNLSWTFNALQRADAPCTTDREKFALIAFFEALWNRFRSGNPRDAYEIVMPIAVLTGDVERYLDLWLGTPFLFSFLSYFQSDSDGFWDKDAQYYKRASLWFYQHRAQLEAALYNTAFDDEAERRRAENAVHLLTRS